MSSTSGEYPDPAPVPRNILVDPLKGPPMEPIKDGDARPELRDEDAGEKQ